MKTFLYALPALAMVGLTAAFILAYGKNRSAERAKKLILGNLAAFVLVCAVFAVMPAGVLAAGEANGDPQIVSAPVSRSLGDGLSFIGAALAVGLSCVGGGIAVANSASAAIGATGENPNNFVRSLIFVALAEGVALYGFIIAIQIIGKL